MVPVYAGVFGEDKGEWMDERFLGRLRRVVLVVGRKGKEGGRDEEGNGRHGEGNGEKKEREGGKIGLKGKKEVDQKGVGNRGKGGVWMT